MLRNIPNKYTRDMILDEIDNYSFKKKYDFFYLPIDYQVRFSENHRINVMSAMDSLTSSMLSSSKNFMSFFI